MEKDMKDNDLMERNMDKESIYIKQVKNMKESFTMV